MPLADDSQVCKLQPGVFLPLAPNVDPLEHTCQFIVRGELAVLVEMRYYKYHEEKPYFL